MIQIHLDEVQDIVQEDDELLRLIKKETLIFEQTPLVTNIRTALMLAFLAESLYFEESN